MIRRTVALVTTMLVAMATLSTPVLASPGDEAGFVNLINQERAARGLNTLDVYWDLVDDARIHAKVMSDADEIFHSSNLAAATTGWAALGENVGVGPTVNVLHTAFMNSAGHRNNILGDWDSVGVGVTHSDKGYLFVTAIFMKSADAKPAPPPAPEPDLEPEPVQAVVTVAPAPAPTPAAVAATAPAPEPEPAEQTPPRPEPAPPEPAPVTRSIDDLLAGADFPFSLE